MDLNLQKRFDYFALSEWKFGGRKCGHVLTGFLYRATGVNMELDSVNPYDDARSRLVAMGVTRLPPPGWGFYPIGTWLGAAYPKFFDAVAKVTDARTIDLTKLTYTASPRAHRGEYNSAQHSKKRDFLMASRANLLYRGLHSQKRSGFNQLKK